MANKSKSNDTGFDWGGNHAGVLVGAAVAGAAVGLAANIGRKLFVQFGSGASGDWVDALTLEHEKTKVIFDKIELTGDDDTTARAHLLAKLKYALSKHATEEEMVVYPALRQHGEEGDADTLTADHGYVKTYLYELENMAKDDPQWLARVRDFRTMIEKHMQEEENEIFPRFRTRLSDEENARLTTAMNKEGFKFA